MPCEEDSLIDTFLFPVSPVLMETIVAPIGISYAKDKSMYIVQHESAQIMLVGKRVQIKAKSAPEITGFNVEIVCGYPFHTSHEKH